MTEEEAFIRAVVDNPGDDTPRLVYADWLDDRADPRGPYLRAEANTLRQFRETADVGPLLTWYATYPTPAGGLDPIWIARVSRPPVGVCCDHVRFDESGPRLTVADLGEVSRWRRVRLPNDYIAFLLNYNGGIPTLPGFYPTQVGSAPIDIGRFFAFYPKGNLRDAGTLHREVDRYWNKRLPALLESKPPGWDDDDAAWYHSFIPVAESVDGQASVMLGVHGENRGRLQLIRWDWTPGSFICEESDQLGGSFAGLLGLIGVRTGE